MDCGKDRVIYSGQKIHMSVAFRNREYKPAAVFHGDPEMEWKSLIGQGPLGTFACADRWQGLLEVDLFDLKAIELLSPGHLSDPDTLQILNRLGFLASFSKFVEVQLLASSDIFSDEGAANILASRNVRSTFENLLDPEKQGLIFLATARLLARLAAGATNEVLTREAGDASAPRAAAALTGPASASPALWAKLAVVDPRILKTIADMLQDAATLQETDTTKGSVVIHDIHTSTDESDVFNDVKILKSNGIENHRGAAASTVVELAYLGALIHFLNPDSAENSYR